MWKCESLGLRSGLGILHMSDFAQVVALPFDTSPYTISSRSALLGKLQQHKGSSSMCSQQAKLGTASWAEVWTLRSTQLAVSGHLLIPTGVGLCVVVLNRTFSEKSKRKNLSFSAHAWCWPPSFTAGSLAAPKGAQECQDLLVAVLPWSKSHPVTQALRPFETLVWCFRSASQHPSTASVWVPRVHINTSPPPFSTIWGVGYVWAESEVLVPQKCPCGHFEQRELYREDTSWQPPIAHFLRGMLWGQSWRAQCARTWSGP